ncbi:hypothetical protein BC828DRAFT_398958 [Blastocladiella britannica]|nr:hypothetical protein BC828DRAFT_398958 [Blastocladiella britannica]
MSHPTALTLPTTVCIAGDNGVTFDIETTARKQTASSLLFFGRAATAEREPVVLKLGLASAAAVTETLSPTDPLRTLLEATSTASSSASPMSNAQLISPPDSSDEHLGTMYEARIHSAIYAHHAAAHTSDHVATVVLAADTVAHGHGLVLPRLVPLQTDHRVPKLPLREIAQMAHDVVAALAGIHEAGYVHCDVSISNMAVRCRACASQSADETNGSGCSHTQSMATPASILETARPPSRRYCLIDFGLACKIDEVMSAPACGTNGFVAPEVLAMKEYQLPAATPAMPSAVWCPVSPALRSCVPLHLEVPPLLHPSESNGSLVSLGFGVSMAPMSMADVSSLASSPPSDRSAMPWMMMRPTNNPGGSPPVGSHGTGLPSTIDSGLPRSISSPTLSSHLSPPTAAHTAAASWRGLRRRLGAARDLYSAGVVLGMFLAPYLPLCDLDHLGSANTTPEYVRNHILPRLRVSRLALRDSILPSHSRVLGWCVDLTLRCLAHSPRARPTARKLMQRHPLCEWVAAGCCEDMASIPEEQADPAQWRSAPAHARLRVAMEDHRHEWDNPTCWELEQADAAAEVAEIEIDDDDDMVASPVLRPSFSVGFFGGGCGDDC